MNTEPTLLEAAKELEAAEGIGTPRWDNLRAAIAREEAREPEDWALRAAEEISAQWNRIYALGDQTQRTAAIIAKHAPAQGVNERLLNAARKVYLTVSGSSTRTARVSHSELKELHDSIAAAESSPPSLEKEAVEALESLLDGLDSNGDPEVCGLTDEQWNHRIRDARALLARYDQKQGEPK